jgi:hypothetical protein
VEPIPPPNKWASGKFNDGTRWSKFEADKSLPSTVCGDLPPRLSRVVLYITEVSIILACVLEILTNHRADN